MMSSRRRRQLSAPGPGSRRAPDHMDLLAFKYMEMCHVESSTDSESEISPRWSDTSTMGCVSSAPESGSLGRALPLVHRPAGRYGSYSLFLDPYDGSSEDSESTADVLSRRGKQPARGGGGGCRFSRRSRRLAHQPPREAREGVLSDVQMKAGGECELWVCELDSLDWATPTQSMDTQSGPHFYQSARPPAPFSPAGRSSSHLPDSSSPSPSNLEGLYKRKLGVAGVGVGQGKRPRLLVNMEDEPTAGGGGGGGM